MSEPRMKDPGVPLRWKVGDYALCMGWHDWPMCFVQILRVRRQPQSVTDKDYYVKAITPVIDWSQHYPPLAMVRQAGETFNAHHSELRPIHRSPTMAEIEECALPGYAE